MVEGSEEEFISHLAKELKRVYELAFSDETVREMSRTGTPDAQADRRAAIALTVAKRVLGWA